VSDEEYVIVWEAPVLEKPEFRLYYGDKGQVVTYTCEKLEGNYIVIDTLTFAEARPDVFVVDGRLVRLGSSAVVSRLYHSGTGVLCEVEDVSIITETDGQCWKLVTINII
jgi:hypothetical protein